MLGYLGGNLEGDEGFKQEVGPEDVHDLQSSHHEHHEGIGHNQYILLELSQPTSQIQHPIEAWDDADSDEQEDPAPNPGGKSIDIHQSCCILGLVLEILYSERTTFSMRHMMSPKSL